MTGPRRNPGCLIRNIPDFRIDKEVPFLCLPVSR
jgi:hypothetical protein